MHLVVRGLALSFSGNAWAVVVICLRDILFLIGNGIGLPCFIHVFVSFVVAFYFFPVVEDTLCLLQVCSVLCCTKLYY